ncbi:hypothetical protein [Labrenzia sp. PHM005]|uniref:hypothetical protein n=1 Tax=Labrenzia sp. PHM005 TaxID=2590016 RepID=UPI0011408B5D|nr:hypothetical protein [Labrenzia sp. PHM005]QDG79370.1 hypothetical protein FJ695_27870 [Labrenzia sp. PHM005]
MNIEFPKQNLTALNGLTLLETFDLLIWNDEVVQEAITKALKADSSFPNTSKTLLKWIFKGNAPFGFDVEARCRQLTAQNKEKDVLERVQNPHYRLRSDGAPRRQKRYILRKVSDGEIIPAKPEAVREAVHLILLNVEALFRNISDGRIEVWARAPTGAREKLDRSDWRSMPHNIYVDFENSAVLLPLIRKRVQRFRNASLVLAEKTHQELNKTPRLSDRKVIDWLRKEFFGYVKFCSRAKVLAETKSNFSDLSEDHFDRIWDKTAPKDWQKSGAIPKKYRGIKILK